MLEPGASILITGAAGIVGTILRPYLSDYQVTLHDRGFTDLVLRSNEQALEGDLLDYDAALRAVAGCEGVIHLAGNRNVDASWPDLAPNFDGTYHVFEASRAAGVRKVIFASSNHVTGMLDRQHQWPVGPEDIAPDSLYGVSKIFGESLGRYYVDNADLSVICLRIGWVSPHPMPDNPSWRRLWLSNTDLGQIMRRALSARVSFGVYYAVSANTPLCYDITNAHHDLGYSPVDDSSNF